MSLVDSATTTTGTAGTAARRRCPTRSPRSACRDPEIRYRGRACLRRRSRSSAGRRGGVRGRRRRLPGLGPSTSSKISMSPTPQVAQGVHEFGRWRWRLIRLAARLRGIRLPLLARALAGLRLWRRCRAEMAVLLSSLPSDLCRARLSRTVFAAAILVGLVLAVLSSGGRSARSSHRLRSVADVAPQTRQHCRSPHV